MYPGHNPYGQPGPPAGPHVHVFIPPRPFNHGLHLVLDAVTCGFWIPVHILLRVLHRG